MKTYTVRAEWDTTGWWVVTVPDIAGAITQSRRLDRVEDDVAEVIELMTGEAPDAYEVDLEWHVPAEAGAMAREAQARRAEAEEASNRSAAATAQAVEALAAEGFTLRDIGAMTGVSYQRAQQLAPAKTRRFTAQRQRGQRVTAVRRRKRKVS